MSGFHAFRHATTWCLALCLAMLTVPVNAKRLALVMGNDNYLSVSKLQKAGNDADAMARELKSAGFAVTSYRDLNYRAMLKAIDAFAESITGGDEVVVFYAGHGVQIKTGAYLLPVDIEAENESQVERTSYGLNDLTERLAEAKPAFTLVMVDACRDNPMKVKGRTVGNTRGLNALEPPKGQMVVYSASRGQQALDRLSDNDSNPNGVFTREFITRMRTPGVKIEDLMRDVQDSVESLAKSVRHDQRPAVYNEARGNFYFYGPTTVQVQQGADDSEAQTWAAAQAANSVTAYQTYLDLFPKGRYVGPARIKLDTIKQSSVKLPPDTEADQWAEVKATGAREYLEAYIAQYPKGKYVALARMELKKLDDADKAKNAKLAMQVPQPKPGEIIKDCPECPQMVVVPAGGFTMGSSAQEQALANAGGYDVLFTDWETPQHYVRINSFAAGRGVVTRGEFANFVSATGYVTEAEKIDKCVEFGGGTAEKPPFVSAVHSWRSVGFAQRDDHPVVCLAWNDVQAYIGWLSQKTGNRYRLLSEAEWEYAARGGTQTPFWWGSSITTAQANYKGSAPSFNGSPKGQWRQATVPVNSFRANPFGLFNVHGNVSELVEDCWHRSYNGAPKNGSVWNTDCDSGVTIRNGAFNLEPAGARSAARFGNGWIKDTAMWWLGFRLARDL